MKRSLLLVLTGLFISTLVLAQPERIAGGLSFATSKRFYAGETGNPGYMLKTWVPVNKRRTMYVVPSVSVYNKLSYRNSSPSFISDSYMFQADLDFQMLVFHEKTLKIAAFAGANGTYIYQHNYNPDGYVIDGLVLDTTDMGFGPNIGASLEMRMGAYWDFIVSAKYSGAGLRFGDRSLADPEPFLTAPLGGPMIQVHAVYYFVSRGRAYSKR